MTLEFMSALSLRASAVLAVVISTVIVVLKRLVFHPLARFPGPKVAAVTWWYMTYYEVFMDGAFVEHLEELHELYGTTILAQHCVVFPHCYRAGPVVRISPDQVRSV